MRPNIWIFAAIMSLGLSSIAQAEDIEMKPLEGQPDVEGQVINGAEVTDLKLWPATFVFLNKKGGGCTATAIGARAILTAAHCVDNNGSGTATISGAKLKVTCLHHPDYQPPTTYSADFALCLTEKEMTGIKYEVINTDSNRPQLKQKVTLLGYGCLTEGGGDHNFGDLYKGTSVVSQKPTHGLYTVTNGGAAVCFGDSGGGSYIELSASGRRVLFGVNSRGDIKKQSWLSTTATKEFLSWAEDWSTANEAAICGLTTGAQGCQGS